eukprot:SAG31_NODE_765_length_12248_cov_6.802947_19_plen_83_part_00
MRDEKRGHRTRHVSYAVRRRGGGGGGGGAGGGGGGRGGGERGLAHSMETRTTCAKDAAKRASVAQDRIPSPSLSPVRMVVRD